jgi:hypothetical protein
MNAKEIADTISIAKVISFVSKRMAAFQFLDVLVTTSPERTGALTLRIFNRLFLPGIRTIPWLMGMRL